MDRVNKSLFQSNSCAHPRYGVTTGVSVLDRYTTVQQAIADDAGPSDLVRPGHIHPLMARDGGVLVRAGQTEGSVDLSRLAGLKPAAVLNLEPQPYRYQYIYSYAV